MDTLTPVQRSERMSRVRDRGGKAEMIVRRLVHSLGYRYRLHVSTLPGKPDMVFPKRRKIIFVHGCFWHRHDAEECKFARLPKSKLDFWLPKLEGNRKRDFETLRSLEETGWRTLVVWECEVVKKENLAGKIRDFLESVDVFD